jgi:hypothetical protein
VLAERLSEQGSRFRDHLVAHAESIALEGILTPGQAFLWRKTAGRKADPLIPARSGPVPARRIENEEPIADLVAELQCSVPLYPRAGSVFSAALGLGIRPPSLALPQEQEKLVRRLDELTVKVIRAWLTRGLNEDPLPRWSILAERVVWCDRVVGSLCTHAELIALDGILTQEVAERTLAIQWKSRGLLALHDPVLASRLGLSRTQREDLSDLLEKKAKLPEEERAAIVSVKANMPDGERQAARVSQEFENRINETDDEIWNVLTASQARVLQRILVGVERRPRRPHKQSKPAGRPG